MKKIRTIIIGSGGHASVVLDILRRHKQFELVGFTDKEKKVGTIVDGLPVLGRFYDMPKLIKEYHIQGAIIAIGDNEIRREYYQYLVKIGFMLVNAIHPNADIAANAKIGKGVVICRQAVICNNAQIGNNTIINTGSIIEHECVIGNHVHIAPGVNIAGRSTVKQMAFIGIGSTVIQCITIHEYAYVGAGSVVIRDIPAYTVAVGVPAKPIKRR